MSYVQPYLTLDFVTERGLVVLCTLMLCVLCTALLDSVDFVTERGLVSCTLMLCVLCTAILDSVDSVSLNVVLLYHVP